MPCAYCTVSSGYKWSGRKSCSNSEGGIEENGRRHFKNKLSRFLFQFCITPQSTTGLSPAEFLVRRLNSHLNLLHPDLRAEMGRRQEKQKEGHDDRTKERQFKPGDQVYIRNFGSTRRKRTQTQGESANYTQTVTRGQN